jgi:ribosome recycling factor
VLKTAEKKGKISQDEQKRHEAEVQKITDKAIVEIDAATTAKEKEILGK